MPIHAPRSDKAFEKAPRNAICRCTFTVRRKRISNSRWIWERARLCMAERSVQINSWQGLRNNQPT